LTALAHFFPAREKGYCKMSGAAVRLTSESLQFLIQAARAARRQYSKSSLEVEEVPTGTCPECDADVHVDLDVDKGELVDCEECGVQLEVVGLDPVELDIVEEESLDDDDDEDEF
jgi:alpha-aminoadipate/glutamate carrier protein LysW